jgi:hypothetical protein
LYQQNYIASALILGFVVSVVPMKMVVPTHISAGVVSLPKL